MDNDNETRRPTVDMVMHISLATVFLASMCAFVEWPQLLAILA
jgi:hypothetical protein